MSEPPDDQPPPAIAPSPPHAGSCPTCRKTTDLCQCAELRPLANRLFVLILQHPQEQDRDLGTALLCVAQLRAAHLAVGLSWPNLAKSLCRPLADPRRWATLYLGAATVAPAVAAAGGSIAVLDRGGNVIGGPEALADLDGIILLDGSWSQAKTLWWRNSWLLKTRRVAIDTGVASRYGKLRREPRRESVSTIEAAAFLLGRLEARPEVERQLLASFDGLLRRYTARGRPAPG